MNFTRVAMWRSASLLRERKAVPMRPVEFKILGPLEVSLGDRAAELQAGKERALLALLVTEAGRVVSIDRLVDELWGEDPPGSANASLRVLISRLRKSLAAIGASDVILTRAPGYVLDADGEHIDSVRFESLAARGRKMLDAEHPAAAANTLRDALSLWRGPALTDASDCRSAHAEAARLEEARLVALEDRINADLECGRHDVLVGELEKLIASHPLRERPWRSMMLALYRSGRQSEALGAYQKLRTALVDEMGVEPSSALSDLQQAILTRSQELDWVPAQPHAVSSDPSALPAGVVTFLLTDIEGSASLWDTQEEATARAVERHEKIISEAVSDHAGTVIKSKGEGDSCLAVFKRASDGAAAAVAIQRSMSAESWPPGAEIRVRVALHTGEAELRDGDYYGRTLNRAARLRGLVRGGQVVCSRATGDLIADDLPAETRLAEIGTYELAGMARPEHVLEICLDGRPATPSTTPAQGTLTELGLPPQLLIGSETTFVGRRSEHERLQHAWDLARNGQRQVILIAGEPGIGKTRLAAELAREAHAAGGVVLFGGCDEELVSPYQPFVEAMRSLVMMSPAEIIGQGEGRVAAEIARLVPEIRGRLPQMPEAVNDPESDRLRLFDAVNALLVAAAKRQPVVLVLDDLHWADQGTLLLLRYLARHADPGRVLIVATYRDVEVSPSHPLADALVDLRRTGLSERISLGGLSGEEIAALLAARARHDLNAPALAFVEVLRRETEGNPFFIEEVVRHLTDAGVVYRSGDRWTSDLPIEDVGIPEGIRDVIGRRIARLPEDAREILTFAAVMGREFRADALEAMGERSEDELLAALDHARDAGLVAEMSSAVGRYTFKHSLVRESLYHGLSTLRRARLHRRVGEALERIYGTRPSPHLSELAHHFVEAGQGEHAAKAVSYAVSAGDYALAQLAYEEATKHYERALEVMEGFDEVDPQRRAEILLSLGEALWRSGNLEASRTSFSEAAAIARTTGDAEILARAALGLGSGSGLFLQAGIDQALIQVLEEAVAALGEKHGALRTRVLARLSDELYHKPDDERRAALAEEAVAVAESLNDASAILVARYARVWTAMGPDTPPDEQLASLSDVLRLAREVGNRELAFQAHMVRGQLLLQVHDLDPADAEVEAARVIADELRIPSYRPWISAYRSMRAFIDGRFDEADRLIGEAATIALVDGKDPDAAMLFGGQSLVQMYNRVDVGTLVPSVEEFAAKYRDHVVTRCIIAFLQSDNRDASEARRSLDALAAHGFTDIPRNASWTTCMWALSVCVAFVEDEACAALLYEMLSPYSGQWAINVGFWMCFGPIATSLGMLAGVLGRYDDAERLFATALEQTERAQALPYLAEAYYRFASMLLKRGRAADRRRAKELAKEARDLALKLGLNWLAAKVDALPI